jgi:hypothetical protein
MAVADYDAGYGVFAPDFMSHVTARLSPEAVGNGTAILRMRDGKVVEHWGGPHCMIGIGLSPGGSAHTRASTAA